MNVIRLFVLISVVLGLQACSVSPLTGQPGYGALPVQYHSVPPRLDGVETIPNRYYLATKNPDNTWTVNMGSPVSPGIAPSGNQALAYYGHNKLWVINGKTLPPRMVVMSHVPHGFGSIQQAYSQPSLAHTGISAETAKILLEELKEYNPCAPAGFSKRITAGGVIGGVITGVLTGDFGLSLVGALIGASGARNGEWWSCMAYKNTRIQLLGVIDAAKARCKSTLSKREEDGELKTIKTMECAAVEAMDFDRIGQGGQTKEVAQPPAPKIVTQVRASRLQEEKPPK